MLDERKSEIVRALVEEHIRTGEPVSSRAILDASGLSVSTATVRNDLAQLENDGYVRQPHTSAGRIPTGAAYRYYVDHLSPSGLRHHTAARINEFFSSVHIELSRLLKSTTSLLSEVTRYPSVVLGPGLGGELIRGAHLVQLGSEVILVVLVSQEGRVIQEVARLGFPVDPEDVEEAERVIAAQLDEHPLRSNLVVEDAALANAAGSVRHILEAVLQAGDRSENASRDIYVGGTSQMATVWEDLSKVHRVLEVFEREAALLEILADMPLGTAVQIGRELGLDGDLDMAMVSTSYAGATGTGGRVGVIGPMRMDYARTISVVEKISGGLGESLGSDDNESET